MSSGLLVRSKQLQGGFAIVREERFVAHWTARMFLDDVKLQADLVEEPPLALLAGNRSRRYHLQRPIVQRRLGRVLWQRRRVVRLLTTEAKAGVCHRRVMDTVHRCNVS
jgi:hypothetical protein